MYVDGCFASVLLLVAMDTAVAFPHPNSKCRKPLPDIRITVRRDNLIDLTHNFDDHSAYWPDNPSGFKLKNVFTGGLKLGQKYVLARDNAAMRMHFSGFVNSAVNFFYSTKLFSQPEHLGTHMDAPIHFYQNGKDVSEIDLKSLIGPGVLINLKRNGERYGPDSQISIDDIMEWEVEREKRMRSGSIVLLYTGYGDVYQDHEAYFGSNMTGADSIPYLHFPGLSPDAAKWLIDYRCIAAVGIDTASIDFGRSTEFGTHRFLSERGIPIFENLANLRELAESGRNFNVIALPQKIAQATGAPLRIVAVLDKVA